MKGYYNRHSPHSRMVNSLIGYLGLAVDMQRVEVRRGDERSDVFLGLNPTGKVPVIEDGDLLLWDPQAILVYLACKHPERGLLPEDARGRAEVQRWLSWLPSYFIPTLGKVMMELVFKNPKVGRETDEAALIQDIATFKSLARILEQHLTGREFLCGALTIADFALGAWAESAPLCGLGYADYPALTAWLERVTRLPGWAPQPSFG
jgi:glutathione S-transferase